MFALRRALVILKRSAYDIYVRQHGTPRVLELLAREDVTVSRMRRSDAHHNQTVEEVREALDVLGVRASVRSRESVGDLTDVDLVITVGGDGTLLAVSHHVGVTPMLGVNSAPQDSVGYLCGTRMGDVGRHLAALAKGEVSPVRLARMRVSVDGDPKHQRVLNEALFCHPRPANTTRYLVADGGTLEEQKSSGVWVSTAAGSSAAVRSAGGKLMPLGSRRLQYVVREPYLAGSKAYAYSKGFVEPGATFELLNKMREARVYIDGPRVSFPVEMGQRVRFELGDEPLRLMGVSAAALDERG